jgi:hypothetical protein
MKKSIAGAPEYHETNLQSTSAAKELGRFVGARHWKGCLHIVAHKIRNTGNA